MVRLLRPHFLAILFALLVGAVLCSGELMSRTMLGASSRGIPAILSVETGDEAWYHAVLNETAAGGEPWNPIIAETPTGKSLAPVLAELVMSLPIRFGLGVHSTVVLWRFLLPFLASLVMYAVTLILSRSRGLALSASIALPTLAWVVAPFFLPLSAFTLFDRPVHPQFEIPILVAFMGCVVIALDKRGKDWLVIPASFLLGMLIYSYLWAWTWGFVFLGLLAIEHALRREWKPVSQLAACALSAAIIGSPQLVHLVQSAMNPEATEYAIRLGLTYGHGFADALVNLPLVFGLAVLMVSRRGLTPAVLRFAGTGIGATFIAANQQLVTGRAFQPDHYVLLIGAPLVLWALLWAAWTRIQTRGEMVRNVFITLVAMVGVLIQLGMQYRIARMSVAAIKHVQPLASVINYLDTNNPNGAVVFMGQQNGILLPALSRHKLWWQTYAMAAPQSRERILQAAFVWFSLAGITPQTLANLTPQNAALVSGYFTMSTSASERERLIRDDLSRISFEFSDFLQTTDASIALRSRRVDYILHQDGDMWDPYRLGPITEVFSDAPFTLYRVEPVTP